MSIKIEMTKYEAVDPGIYPGKITSIDEEEGKFGPQIKFTFELETDNGDQKTLIGWTSKRFSKKSKLYSWTTSLLGVLPDNYTFDSDDLIGKEVLLVVGLRHGTDGVTLFNSIESIKPMNQKKPVIPSNGKEWLDAIVAEPPA